MEEIGSSLNQSMADIFETKSPLAKRRDKLRNQIKEARVILDDIKTSGDMSLVSSFLRVFYNEQEYNKQVKRLEKLDEVQVLTSLYNVLSSRMDALDNTIDEIENITEI